MFSIGMKELKNNPKELGDHLEHSEPALITRRGRPIGIAVPWDDAILENGYRQTLAVRAFEEGTLTLGQLAEAMGLSREEALKLLGTLGIPYIERDAEELEEELAVLHS
jgi:predicted HTH domain antitoxin